MPLVTTDLKTLPAASPADNTGSIGDATTSPQITGGSSSPSGTAPSGNLRASGTIPVTPSHPNDNGLQGVIDGLLHY